MRLLLMAVLAGLSTIVCPAQTSHGYAFLGSTLSGPGDGTAFRYGVGGTAHVGGGVGLGGEIGGIRFDGGHGGLAALHAAHHFPMAAPGRRTDPFVLGGVALAFAGGELGAYWLLGGGVQYWVRPRLAVRVELRGYPGGADINRFAEVRFGLAFR